MAVGGPGDKNSINQRFYVQKSNFNRVKKSLYSILIGYKTVLMVQRKGNG